MKYAPASTPIEAFARATDGGVTVAVSSHGPGVARDELDRIFTRFYRSPKKARRATAGTGIASPSAAGSVEAHRVVKYWAENFAPDGGMSMTVTLQRYDFELDEVPASVEAAAV